MAAAVDPKSVPTTKLISGFDIPVIGWGTFGANDDLGTKATHTALAAGYRVGLCLVLFFAILHVHFACDA